jgi:3-hydroxyisobutyrate dehydrogenase-like beta-hydroxyacid dehydrogenase
MENPITVLGLGPMGRALAAALLGAGHPTTVWNRTPGRAGELLARGATEAATVADAVRSADTVVACLRDYDSLLDLLDPLDGWSGRTLVNLTSGDPRQAGRAAA